MSLGSQIKALLESTFDLVAGVIVTYVSESGVVYATLPAIWYDEATRFRRDKLNVSDEGMLDENTKRLVLKQSTLLGRGITLNVAGYFIINGIRWDFAANEPAFQDSLTPFAGVVDMFVLMYLRRAIEVTRTETSVGDTPFGIQGWST